MPLFRDNPLKSAAIATVAVAVGHYVSSVLASPGASALMQSIVAITAIGALVGLIVLHHRQEGQLLTQDQEEYILIGGLALTWIVITVAWRALSGGGGGGGHRSSSSGWGSKGGRDPWLADGWGADVVEEYYDYY